MMTFLLGCSSSKVSNTGVGSLTNTKTTSQAYYPTSEELEYKNTVTADKDNWCQVVKSAPSQTTILLEDGEYTNACAIRNKSYITIKAKNKYGVTFTGDDFFLTLEDKNHHINLLGIEATTTTDNFNSGLFKAHGYGNFDNHHIYIKDCWIHHSGSGILTGPRNHDITVDKCLIHDIKMGYAWYALGWHMTMSNCVVYHLENNGFVARGHFPLNRFWDYDTAETADVTQESNLENIPKDEWTHRVIGNFFGEGYGRVAARSWERGSAIAFYMGRGNNDGDDAYLPPQNVLIEDNVFYNITPSVAPDGEIFAGAITIDAEAGFSSSRKDKVAGLIEGTVIRNNTSNVPIIKSFWEKPDMRLITQSQNKSLDTGLLEKEFLKRIEYLQRD